MTVGDMLDKISSVEIAEWLGFYRIEADEKRKAHLASDAVSGAKKARRRR